MSERLAGKVAIVTGIGSGIGHGVARMFAREGARVVGCDIDAGAAAGTHGEALADGLVIDSQVSDLLNPVHVDALIVNAIRLHGRIDAVVNAAATAVFAWIEDMTYEQWRRTLAGELDLVFLLCKAAWPHLKERGGSIVNFASANAHMALEGSPALAHCAGKGGVLAMTRQLAMEGGPFGIRANTISPGMIVTGATKPVLAAPAFEERVLAKAMIKRLGQPDDIAHCATYLVSDESTYVTGADFSIDAGATAW